MRLSLDCFYSRDWCKSMCNVVVCFKRRFISLAQLIIYLRTSSCVSIIISGWMHRCCHLILCHVLCISATLDIYICRYKFALEFQPALLGALFGSRTIFAPCFSRFYAHPRIDSNQCIQPYAPSSKGYVPRYTLFEDVV